MVIGDQYTRSATHERSSLLVPSGWSIERCSRHL
jgi:hypothetical protein